MKRKLKKQAAKKVSKRQPRTLDATELAQVSGGTYYYTTTKRTYSSSSGCYGSCSAG